MDLPPNSSKLNRRKSDFLFLYILLIPFLFLSSKVLSATITPIGHSDLILVAKKGSKQFRYKLGKHLLVQYGNSESRFAGELMEVSKDSITLFGNRNKFLSKSIAIKDINSITVLHKKGRKNWVLNLILLSVSLGLGIFLTNKFPSGILLISLPLLFTGVTMLWLYLPFLLMNFMFDVFSKKIRQKGWNFHAK
jgi:hypothetical protein